MDKKNQSGPRRVCAGCDRGAKQPRAAHKKENKYQKHAILERIVILKRTVIFRVIYTGDDGRPQVHNDYRIQFNSAVGPYKGGIRLHPSVDLGVLKFLGFEQIFKNSLTGVNTSGAKGGSAFDPKGNTVDVPAGDIGVGTRDRLYVWAV